MQFSEIFMAIILKTFREQIYGETVQQTERSDIRWAKRGKRCEWLNRVNVLKIAIRTGLWEGASRFIVEMKTKWSVGQSSEEQSSEGRRQMATTSGLLLIKTLVCIDFGSGHLCRVCPLFQQVRGTNALSLKVWSLFLKLFFTSQPNQHLLLC